MSAVKPFRAYRPRPDLARLVASFPYDVISSDEARALAAGNPHSFLHVGKPEIDLDPSIPLHDDRVYATARANLARMIFEGVLQRDARPCLSVYQQRMGDHVQAGVVGLTSVAEYERDLIKKHEHTRKDKEDDRTRHVTECDANAEPVFLTYRKVPAIDAIVDRVRARPPLHDLVTVPAHTWHQFRAADDAPLGFLCMVDAARDKPELPDAAALEKLRAQPEVAAFLADAIED